MDYGTLLEIVDELVEATSRMSTLRTFGDHDDWLEARDDALRLVAAVRAIAEVIPGAPSPSEFDEADTGWNYDQIHAAGLRLQGLLRVRAKLSSALHTVGPTLSVEALHDWVWRPAAALWRDGHHRNAIHAAAAQVETQLQAKLGREDISGVALIREAFSLKEPEPGKPRLRFAWLAPDGEAFKSAHEGTSAFGAGCFQLIRNSAAHRPTKLNEFIAIEHLVCLSYLARLIEAATILGVPPSPDASERPFG